MEHESIFNKTIAIVGAGPAGCTVAKFLSDYGFNDITLFDKGKFLRTILPTGGGRCNLAHAEYDFKQLAQNYPRGEKFLYSLFSRFSTSQTIDLMKQIGIKTYTQEDDRIFPISNSAGEVREKILQSISNCPKIKEEVEELSKLDNDYKIKTNKSTYAFDIVVIAIGGHAGTNLLKDLDIKIVPQTKSLVGLITQNDFSEIAGVSLKNVQTKLNKNILQGDILFTHKGLSGPLVYKISSIKARDEMPYSLHFKLVKDFDLQELLDKNSHKTIKNLLGIFVPKSFAQYILNDLKIYEDTECHKINGKTRNKIYATLTDFTVTINAKANEGEVVTCGGVDLKEVNSKTLEAKKYPNLYFCGEILDIDGFCGGFNLQNCWTTGFVVAESIYNKK